MKKVGRAALTITQKAQWAEAATEAHQRLLADQLKLLFQDVNAALIEAAEAGLTVEVETRAHNTLHGPRPLLVLKVSLPL